MVWARWKQFTESWNRQKIPKQHYMQPIVSRTRGWLNLSEKQYFVEETTHFSIHDQPALHDLELMLFPSLPSLSATLPTVDLLGHLNMLLQLQSGFAAPLLAFFIPLPSCFSSPLTQKQTQLPCCGRAWLEPGFLVKDVRIFRYHPVIELPRPVHIFVPSHSKRAHPLMQWKLSASASILMCAVQVLVEAT